jgi:hypothetical protein
LAVLAALSRGGWGRTGAGGEGGWRWWVGQAVGSRGAERGRYGGLGSWRIGAEGAALKTLASEALKLNDWPQFRRGAVCIYPP